jgi:hypothetical protein
MERGKSSLEVGQPDQAKAINTVIYCFSSGAHLGLDLICAFKGLSHRLGLPYVIWMDKTY